MLGVMAFLEVGGMLPRPLRLQQEIPVSKRPVSKNMIRPKEQNLELSSGHHGHAHTGTGTGTGTHIHTQIKIHS